MRYNRHPQLRPLTIRILLMVPVYAAQVFFALMTRVQFEVTSEVLEFARQAYEAIVIFSVLQFLLVCAGGHLAVMHRSPTSAIACSQQEDVDEPEVAGTGDRRHAAARGDVSNQSIPHAWPLHFLPPWRSARGLAKWCIRGTLPYVVTSMICAMIGLAVWITKWCKQSLEGESGGLIEASSWVLPVFSCFAVAALYDLTHGLMDRLAGLNPWGKLIAVKLVVFFTFYQTIVITKVLDWTSLFESFVDLGSGWKTPEQIAEGVSNFLLCVEMTLASFVHFYAFPPEDYKQVLVSRGVFLDSATARPLQFADFSSIALNLGDAVKCRDIFRTAWDAGMPKKMKPSCRPSETHP